MTKAWIFSTALVVGGTIGVGMAFSWAEPFRSAAAFGAIIAALAGIGGLIGLTILAIFDPEKRP